MRGGARVGAGRKPIETPRKRLVLYVTDEERGQLTSYLENLRLPEAMAELEAAEDELIEILEAAATGEMAAPTVATAARIVEVEAWNHGMTRGKWDCIAGILNRNLQFDARLEPWTAETVKKAFQKAKKEALA
ncbi:MAG: hypothetical protein VB117_12995 [[Clostridium] scindens]|uniref:hypothetical protein n=1 Tax=Clostridium scindens (strain JCM 10418 / VPI 12708) TaxID=29347 RepID=UPI002B208EC3|nr:hypothetical protein [[Clostridium] scindens]MEA4819544.1 hypothetical protein [[Clostridium] scindens]